MRDFAQPALCIRLITLLQMYLTALQCCPQCNQKYNQYQVFHRRFIALLALAAAQAPNELASAFCRSIADMLPVAGPSLLLDPASLPNKLGFLASLLSCCFTELLPAPPAESPSMLSNPLKDVGPVTCRHCDACLTCSTKLQLGTRQYIYSIRSLIASTACQLIKWSVQACNSAVLAACKDGMQAEMVPVQCHQDHL